MALSSFVGQILSETSIGGIVASIFLLLLLILSAIGGYFLYHSLHKKARKYNLKQRLLSGPETEMSSTKTGTNKNNIISV